MFDLIKERGFECQELKPGSSPALTSGAAKALSRMLQKSKSKRSQSLLEPLDELTKESMQACHRCAAGNPPANSFCGQCGAPLRGSVTAKEGISEATGARTAEQLTDQGFARAEEDDWTGAVEHYRKALELDPKYVRAHANLGYALNRLRDYEGAIKVLSDAIQVTDDRVLLHRMFDARGFAHSNLKELDQAIADFSEAIRQNPRNARVHHHRAESRAQAGSYEEAYTDALNALKLDPAYPPALRLKTRLELEGFVKPLAR